MTKEELSQLYWLNKEIEKDKNELAKLQGMREGKSTAITSLPGNGAISDKSGELAAQIADLERTIEINIKRCLQEQKRLTDYINNIDDSLVRMILHYRYISGFSWVQVARHIGNNTEDNVRMIHSRFLKDEKNKG